MPPQTQSRAIVRRHRASEDKPSPSPESLSNLKDLFARIEALEANADVPKRLDELDRKLEILLEMACPVCGPKLAARLHPEQQALIDTTASQIMAARNGHDHP